MKLIGLADCNSFYASCEKVFRPDLAQSPVVVLSNNDGCIVALSKEAKSLGITRGIPYFKVKNDLLKMHVAVFSSNYTLYQDLSDRIMEFIKSRTESIEIYSIDESFFHVPEMSLEDYTLLASDLNKSIKKCMGMPVSIGMARTKTLAKIANHYAKKHSSYYVLCPNDEKALLAGTSIDDVWGIGYRSIPKLLSHGIKTALDFALADDDWILKNFSICGLRTAQELRGISVIEPENPNRQSFSSSISFPKGISDFDTLQNAISCHCSTVCNKLYSKNLKASDFAIQLIADRFKTNYGYDIGTGHLEEPSCYTPTVMTLVRKISEKIIHPEVEYKTIRVIAWNLTPFSEYQYSLFEKNNRSQSEDAVSEAVYKIGMDKISCATQGKTKKRDLANFRYLSPCYTTKWNDLPVVGRSDLKIR